MTSEELKKRTKMYGHRCVKVASALPNGVLGKYLASQLMRSALSVGANYRASCVAQSRATFAAKISIAFEECDETLYWLEFIVDEKLIAKDKLNEITKEGNELCSILGASRKTAQKKQKNIQ